MSAVISYNPLRSQTNPLTRARSTMTSFKGLFLECVEDNDLVFLIFGMLGNF